MPQANQMIRAQFVPSTMNAEERTVDVVFATPTPVLRYSWSMDEYYNEVLDMNGANLERTSKGLPVLDNHGRWGSVGQILGRAEDIRREGESYVATVRFSKREAIQEMVTDIQDGIISDISFGYSVDKVERMEKKDGDQYRTYMVRNWTPNEISFVTIPADPKAGVRSASGEENKGFDLPDMYSRENPEPTKESQILNQGVIMKREQIIAMLEKRGISVDASITDEALQAELERALNVEGNDPKAITAAVEAERKRTAEIFEAVRAAKLPNEFAENLVKEGKSIDQARAAVIAEFAKNDKGVQSHVNVGEDRSAELRKQAATASLIMRSEPNLLTGKKRFSDEAMNEAQKNYRHMTLVELAKDSLERGGDNVEGLSKMELVGRAFTSSSSDFPVLLEGANRTVLLAAYEAQADTWRRFCATGSVSDFREHKRLRMGTFNDLDKVNENGEFKNKKITDANYEKVSIGTKGNIINVSRQMIINDDLGAFLRLASMLGRSAARSIENDVYALLASNPTLADGIALFHANHGNLVTGGAAGAPSVAALDAMRQLMAKQKDKDGNDFLDIRPELALAPLSLGGSLRLLNTSQYDNDGDKLMKPNIVAGLFRDVIDTPRLSGNAYFMFADPSVEPVVEVNFLNGEQSPYMESENGFSIDGTQWKIRLDYGVNAVGFRGVVKNAGA